MSTGGVVSRTNITRYILEDGHGEIYIFNIIFKFIRFFLPTVKPAQAVTSIKQSPVSKGNPFLVLSQKIPYELNLFQEITCLKKPVFLCPNGDVLIQAGLHFENICLVIKFDRL